MNIAYRLRMLGTIVICAASFAASYDHGYFVAHTHGNAWYIAATYPIIIDFTILVAALTLATPTGVNRMTKLWANGIRYVGFAATLAFNLMASNWASTETAIVCLVPGVFLIGTVEMLIHAARGTAATRAKRPVTKPKGNVTPIRKAG
jgi:hypothetical protein